MNKSINQQSGEVRELSITELDQVSGGNTNINFGPLRISAGNGDIYIGLKGLGTLWIGSDGVVVCPPGGGTCAGVSH